MENVDVMIPQDKAVLSPDTFNIGGRAIVFEALCTYKVTSVLSILSKVSQEINLTEMLMPMMGLTSLPPDMAVQVAGTFIPKLLAHAPDALVRMVAVCVIPNAELKQLFSGGPGAIEERVKQEMAFLYIDATADQVLDLANHYVQLMGADALKNALSRLMATASNQLGISTTPST